MGFFFFQSPIHFGVSVFFLNQNLYKDDSRLCYERYNGIYCYTILHYAICG